jgi:hypothetical protein
MLAVDSLGIITPYRFRTELPHQGQ